MRRPLPRAAMLAASAEPVGLPKGFDALHLLRLILCHLASPMKMPSAGRTGQRCLESLLICRIGFIRMTTCLTSQPLSWSAQSGAGARCGTAVRARRLPDASPHRRVLGKLQREDQQSVVADGPMAGRTLHELWRDHRTEIFGAAAAAHPSPRFPLLVEVTLDAACRSKSPGRRGRATGGRTEVGSLAHGGSPGRGGGLCGRAARVARESFQHALADGTAANSCPACRCRPATPFRPAAASRHQAPAW